ncbi:MAG TPA: NAD(P)/FAD-dependent oxidoreductase [Acidimicrobiales bacterium]|nr:NAD(P)/FAD-dependent oxidoreductase [Acidimicrobiales bacterium]
MVERARGGWPRILIVGGGYIGLYTALRLEETLAPHEAEVTLVSPENFMLYRPLLPEVASGSLEPRHAVVPLRQALRRTTLVAGRLTGLDHQAHSARVQPYVGEELTLGYDHVVIGLGAMSKLFPIPGLVDHAVGFTSIGEAIHLRNAILACLEAAASTRDDAARARALTFCFVGGGYTGVEALAELQDMAADACRWFPTLDPAQLRWVLVEATDRLLPSFDPALAQWTLDLLRERGVEVHLETTVKAVEDGVVQLSTGKDLPTDTLVWATGLVPHTLAGGLGLPADERGRLEVEPTLQVTGSPGAWAAGDCARVPDLVGGGTCPPTAQYAVREARQLGDNLAAALRGETPAPFRYESKGEFVTLGMRKAVGQVKGRRLAGMTAWALRRAYYASQIPTANRKVRLALDWTVAMPFRHDPVNLESEEEPKAALEEAAAGR